MRKMKDSGIEWIGEIPEDWEVGRIGELYTERKEKVSDKDFMPLSVTMKGILPQLASAAKSDAHDDRKLVRKGDFAINSRSDRRGSCGISDYDGSVSLINTILTPRNNMNPNYYNWLFHTTLFADEFYKWGHGIVDDLWTTNWSDMKNITIPVPLVTAQQQIADFLDDKVSQIDSVISKTRETIEEYKKLKQSIITEVVTGKVKIENEKVCGMYDTYKDSGIEWIGEIPSEWNVIRTKFISDSMSKGNGITKEQIVQNGDSPCVRYGEIYSKYNHSFSNCITKTNKSMYTNLQYFSYGDILFACTGELPEEIGKNIVYLGNEDCLAGGDIIVMKHSQNPSFLNYVYNSYGQTQKSLGKTKLKVVHISPTEIANIFVALPSLPEQHQIADFLDKKCSEIDKLITKKEQLVVELEAYKKSLIYEVVTGKKEIC